jgi:uncharacterized membrane protein
MSQSPAITDQGIERMVSVLLRTGVLLSGAVVLAGGIYFLVRHGADRADVHRFVGEPATDRLLNEIVAGAIALRPRSFIQTGILVLIATPILRVALSLVGFAMERDHAYVWITFIVLCTLLFSLITGAAGG